MVVDTLGFLQTRRRALRLPEPLKTIALSGYTDIFLTKLLKRGKEGTKTQFKIGDYKLFAYSLNTLSLLYYEIFLNHTYFFVAKNDHPIILDCGSNIGMSVLYFKALYPHASITAFEPSPHTYSLLEENIRVNELANVRPIQAALGGDETLIDFFIDEDDPGSLVTSVFSERTPKQNIRVNQVKLSSYIDGDVDLLKLDIEGSEVAVIHDLISTGTLNKIDQMLIEYHHHINRTQDNLSEFLLQLESNGFGYQIKSSYPTTKTLSARPFYQDIHLHVYRK